MDAELVLVGEGVNSVVGDRPEVDGHFVAAGSVASAVPVPVAEPRMSPYTVATCPLRPAQTGDVDVAGGVLDDIERVWFHVVTEAVLTSDFHDIHRAREASVFGLHDGCAGPARAKLPPAMAAARSESCQTS